MKKILILGGSHAEIPLIKSAKKLGFYVYSTGNNTDGLGHTYADEYHKEDFSNKNAILLLVKKLKVDAICPGANDFAAITASYVAEKLSINCFDNYETSLIIHHKDKFREFSIHNNLTVPKAKSFDDIDSALSYINQADLPLILKPVDLSGGKGIQKVDKNNMSNIVDYVKNSFTVSKQKKIVVEEFIEGTNHGLTCIIIDKKVAFSFCDNEHYYINKYMVSGASSPCDVPATAIADLIKESEKCAQVLNLKDGIFHIQFILKDNKNAYIIEICRRPPGDLYIDFVKYATGVDYPTVLIKFFSGLPFSIEDLNITKKDFITRHCVMTNRNGFINTVTFDDKIKDNIIDKLMWWSQEEEIIDFNTYKAGIVFIKYNSIPEMIDKSRNLHNLIKINIKQDILP